MNAHKQQRKLIKLERRAERCLSRAEAVEIIRKADNVHRKLSKARGEQAALAEPHRNSGLPPMISAAGSALQSGRFLA